MKILNEETSFWFKFLFKVGVHIHISKLLFSFSVDSPEAKSVTYFQVLDAAN